MSRAATSDELALFRSSGQWSRVRAAIFTPSTIYSGRVNQVFSSLDRLLEVTYDGGSGTLADVLPDMTVFFGSTAGAWDKGIARVRSIDASKVYIGEAADLSLVDNDYITVVNDFGLWARPILISGGVPYMDGGEAYTDQFTNWLPVPKMGPDLVLKKTASTVSYTFDFSASFVPSSSVASRSSSAPGSSSSSGMTTATPTVTWNTVGWFLIYHTLTGANGKVFFGVRKVFIWDEDHLPPLAQIDKNPKGSTDSGGWEFGITLFDEASLSQVRDHAFVILFSDDHYGPYNDSTEISIGPVAGAENILAEGWIAKESINWDPEAGSVSFTAYTAQYWLAKIPAWPFGVEFTTGAASWTKIQNLTIDLGLAAFFHYATTAYRIMDITLTSDGRYTAEVKSLASNLWAQIQEIAWDQIYARPLVNCLNQLYIEIHPQLTPTGSRSWPTVLEILPGDILRGVDFERSTLDELSILDLSGVLINSSGNATALFSLAPGRSHSHYGNPDIQPKRLLASQAQSNTLAGLYRSWINNPYKSISLSLAGNNRLVDIAPRQKCTITIAAGNTKRGISYSGGLIPLSVERVHDRKSGLLHTEVTFEAETRESRAENGDVPGSIDISVPPLKPLPPLPPLDPIFPGGISTSADGPIAVVFHDDVAGMLVAENFDTTPVYSAINSGLPVGYKESINWFYVMPSGELYVAFIPGSGTFSFLARAPSVGGTLTVLYDSTSDSSQYLWGIGANPLTNQIGFIRGASGANRFYVGSGSSYTAGLALSDGNIRRNGVSYGFGAWLLTYFNQFIKVSASGTSLLATGTTAVTPAHLRGGTTGITYHPKNGTNDLIQGQNNLGTNAIISSGNSVSIEGGSGNDVNRVADSDPTGQYIMTRALAGSRAKSPDFGATWATMGSLPVGNYSFGYAGSGSGGQRFIAVGAVIRATLDFGVSWITKENSSLTALSPFPDVDLVQVLEY